MYWKNSFIYTLREDPSEAETISNKLMLRAGMIQKVSAGIYNYLPLGLRVIKKIEQIIREEMNKRNAVELLMPMVIPAELWQESGRWNYYGPELLRFTDRKNNSFCLGPTHEEVISDVVRRCVRSYRDLPICLYQIQTKFRDEIRPRFGLMRCREFIMKDAYSFHANENSLNEMYQKMYEAYVAIFSRCGLNFRAVEADSGNIGGSITHEFHVLADSGEDTIAFCDTCNYAANIEKAESWRLKPAEVPFNALKVKEIATPDKTSIEDVATFLNIEPSKTIKMLIYETDKKEYIGVCIRGDLTVNETKLKNILDVTGITIPQDEMIKLNLGLPVGYLGPINIKKDLIKEIICDFSVQTVEDGVCGANKEGFHLQNVYPVRDFDVDRYVDIATVKEGDYCPKCEKGKLVMRKGIEVGQIFKLGDKYSKPMSLTFLNENNLEATMIMGCYGIGVGRTAAAAIEQNHDEDGIIWPIGISPYTATILCLDVQDDKASSIAEKIYNFLESNNIDTLYDNREERAGVKFKDADLIGCPYRITVGLRGIKEGIIELKKRNQKNIIKIPVDSCLEKLVKIIEEDKNKNLI